MAKIDVDWETVSDGLTDQGQGFEDQMKTVIAAGDTIEVTLPDESKKSFSTPEEFGDWMKMLRTPPGQQVDD